MISCMLKMLYMVISVLIRPFLLLRAQEQVEEKYVLTNGNTYFIYKLLYHDIFVLFRHTL